MTTITTELEGRTISSKTMAVLKKAMDALKEVMGMMPEDEDMPMDDEGMKKEMSSNFAFFELTGLTPGKPFAGFAVGDFVDMYGRSVKFSKDRITNYLKNTLAAISSVKAKGRPGLPIDGKNHDKGEAAGWITGAEIGEIEDSAGNLVPAILLSADWTTLGVKKLSEKVMTGFSPTVDQTKERIMGGSLTNWDASVDSNGIPLFHAIELSNRADLADESRTAFLSGDGTMAIELTQEQLDELVSKRVEAALTEAVNTTAKDDGNAANRLTELVEAKVNARWQEKIELMQRESAAAELARDVTAKGIPYQAEVLTAELMKLPPAQLEFWGNALKTIATNGLNDFAELGHGKRVNGKVNDPFVTRLAQKWVQDGNELEQLFAINPELGDMAQYDLSEVKNG